MFGIPAVFILLVYARLLFGPIDMSFIRASAESMVRAGLSANTDLALGDVSLSISPTLRPVLRFAPVVLTDHNTGAEIKTDALEIGFSPLQAIYGQPAAVVTLVNPQVQVLQDLLGPRLASFTTREDPATGETIVEIREGNDAYPPVKILPGGLVVTGETPGGDGIGLRSDNDWLIYNMEATERAIANFALQARAGRFSRLEVRGGQMEMLDPVYGFVRKFENLHLVIKPNFGTKPTTGEFAADLAGRRVTGTFSHVLETGDKAMFRFAVENLDFAALMPMIDDPDALLALRGTGKFAGELVFDRQGGRPLSGKFNADIGGTELRMRHDFFPVRKGAFDIAWAPDSGRFTLAESELAIGKSSARISGEFVLGLDDVYGPTVGISMTARQLLLQPEDMPAPRTPFDEVSFSGWSAPLYGAIGIDRMVARKPGVEIRAKGRLDMVRKGIGVNLEVGGEGASADDLKRIWPFFISRGARDWFVAHVTSGTVDTASLKFKVPVGALDPNVEDQPLPPGSANISLVGSHVAFIPVPGMAPIDVGGKTRLSVRDNKTSVQMGATTFATASGKVAVKQASVIIDSGDPTQPVFEFSADVDGAIPALIQFADAQAPGMVAGIDLPFKPANLSGNVAGSIVATLTLGADSQVLSLDYAATGSVKDFASSELIAARRVADGQFAFRATPQAYHVSGTASLDGVPAELVLDGSLDGGPNLKVASTMDAADFAKFGFDVSQLLAGKVRFVAKPLDDGSLQLAVDLTEAQLTIKDIGLTKPHGVPGTLNAEIREVGTETRISKIDLNFGDAHVRGDVVFDKNKGLVSADFSRFALSEGDSASLDVKPDGDGFAVTIRGDQFDLKPMLRRYFALDKTSTGAPQATSVNQAVAIDVSVKRALGFYSVTAYNFQLGLTLKGEDVLKASLQAQFTEGNTISLITNPSTGGRLLSVAFNDAGTVLRFLNVYPRLLGGSGSLTMRTDLANHVDTGEIRMKNFSLVGEDRIAEIVGNHKDSRNLIAKNNRLNFGDGRAQFVRRSDRIEVKEAVIDGGSFGGTLRGFMYTKARQYDLVGTYIPLLGLNSIFQKLPLIGQILGGRKGEGLVGVTFAVRGDLDNPHFLVNPVSLLAPGLFRSLFEFRAQEAPREAQDGQVQPGKTP